MSPQMGPQIEIQRESLAADFTFVRFLSSVDQLMPLELGVVQELLVAALNLTNEHSLSMGHLMLAVRAIISEYLLTVVNRAGVPSIIICFLVWSLTVNHHVQEIQIFAVQSCSQELLQLLVAQMLSTFQ